MKYLLKRILKEHVTISGVFLTIKRSKKIESSTIQRIKKLFGSFFSFTLLFCSLALSPLFSSTAWAETEPSLGTSPSQVDMQQQIATINAPGLSSTTQTTNALGIPAITMTNNAAGGQDYSINLQILGIMTALSFLPALVIMMTSFIRITVVMSILRQATGLQQAPSNQIIVGIALFMTFFIMSPVFDKVNETALQPYLNEQMSSKDAFTSAQEPFREFMLRQTRTVDLESFAEIAQIKVSDPKDVPMRVLIPSFVTSELKTAFQIGFMLFLPFLVIDLVVASILMSMGMMMLSPMIVSLPFKLMLFVLVDGWSLVLRSLAGSFGI